MRTVGAKLDNSEYDIFEFCCSEHGFTKSEMLRTLIKDFVEPQKESEELEIKVEDVRPRTEGTIKRVIPHVLLRNDN